MCSYFSNLYTNNLTTLEAIFIKNIFRSRNKKIRCGSSYLFFLQIFSRHPKRGSEGCRVVRPGVPGLPHCPRFFLGQKSIWLLGRYFFASHSRKEKKDPHQIIDSCPKKNLGQTENLGQQTCHVSPPIFTFTPRTWPRVIIIHVSQTGILLHKKLHSALNSWK